MKKKLAVFLAATCACVCMASTAMAQTTEPAPKANGDQTEARLVKDMGNTTYWLEGNKLIKYEATQPAQVSLLRDGVKNDDGTITVERAFDIRVGETTLAPEEVQRAVVTPDQYSTTAETAYIRAYVKVNLNVEQWPDSVRYSFLNASGGFTRLQDGGPVPSYSDFDWMVYGDLYYKGDFDRNGGTGGYGLYNTTTFSGVTLMSPDQAVGNLTGGNFTYKIYPEGSYRPIVTVNIPL